MMMEGPQRKAQQLLDMADAVEQSNRNRRNIVKEMNQQRLAIVEDFENSFASADTGSISLSTVETSSSASAKGKVKMEKNSKTKIIVSLKQQLHDCQSALVEIKENAALKYLKLEMEYDDLNESYSKLEAAKDQTQKKNEALKKKLASAVGDIRVERLAEMESAQAKLEMEVEQVKLERDKAKKETGELRSLCCEVCQSKMKASVEEPAPSLMRSLLSLFQLDDEARATEETFTVAAIGGGAHQQPPKQIVVTQSEEPQCFHDDLEPPQCINDDEMKTDAIEKPQRTTGGDDLEAMEKTTKDDIEKMHNEWNQSRKKRVDTHPERQDMKNTEQTKNARNRLDSFFSQATAGLEDEEMEEEKSLFSLQRQCRSLSATPKVKKSERVRKRRYTHSTTNESLKEKCATVQDFNTSDDPSNRDEACASGPNISYDEPDRRQSLMTMAALSFRGSIANLMEEGEPVPRKSFDRRLENLGAKSSRANVSPKKSSKTSPRTKVEKCATEQDVNASDDPSNKDEASASGPTISYDEPDRRQSLITMAALSFRGSIANLMEEEESVPRKSSDRRPDNLRAKSLRADVSLKKPSNTSLRKKVEHKTSRSVRSKDFSQEQNKVHEKIRKEVENWAALDLAPILALDL